MTQHRDTFSKIQSAIAFRKDFFQPPHQNAFRLFNGFSEGAKQFSIDIYAKTAVIHDHRSLNDFSLAPKQELAPLCDLLLQEVPFVKTIVHKMRKGKTAEQRNGVILVGSKPDNKIVENNIKYALNPLLNRDSSFYLDTRNVRTWLGQHMAKKTVLNTFAYTGSLGVAAAYAGANVFQTDLNRAFLNAAKQSYSLNGLPIQKNQFITGDFFLVMKQLTRQQKLFDCIILDPPFFSTTSGGTVDLESNMIRLINKVRPLVKNKGKIIAINNAIFLSGKAYMERMENLCEDGYVSIDTVLEVPQDCVGYQKTSNATDFIDPHPFNHSTKTIVLSIQHKS